MTAQSSLTERFLRYTGFDTQAAEGAQSVPSSEGQRVFALHLAAELRALGLADAVCDEHAYVLATLPSNVDRAVPTVALIAHLDTAVEVSGRDVRPRIVRYAGGDLPLDEAGHVWISLDAFPELARFVGEELIVTDGATLLGADDKAGIAAIVETARYFKENPDRPHGTVKIVFTPDEEIGHGASLLDLERLGADFAYTVDGGDAGEYNWETFNAARARAVVTGRSVHPGMAKNKMKNALWMLAEFVAMLPADERPETTEGRQGFFHLVEAAGDVERATAEILIRDHDRAAFSERKAFLCRAARQIEAKYGESSCTVEMRDQYYNMADKLRGRDCIVDYAKEAMRRAGVEPREIPVRGGTDGSMLSWRGLPAPNLFTGGLNAHGRQEFLPVRSLELAYETVRNLVEIVAER